MANRPKGGSIAGMMTLPPFASTAAPASSGELTAEQGSQPEGGAHRRNDALPPLPPAARHGLVGRPPREAGQPPLRNFGARPAETAERIPAGGEGRVVDGLAVAALARGLGVHLVEGEAE